MNKRAEFSPAQHILLLETAPVSGLAVTNSQLLRITGLLVLFVMLVFGWANPVAAESFSKHSGNRSEQGKSRSGKNKTYYAESNRSGNSWQQRKRGNSQRWQNSKSGNEYFNNGNKNYNSHQGSSQYLKHENSGKRNSNYSNNSQYYKREKRTSNSYQKHKRNYEPAKDHRSPYDKFASDWNKTKKVQRDKWTGTGEKSKINYDSHKHPKKYGTKYKRHEKHEYRKHRHYKTGKHVDRHRPKYNIYKRKKYVYYRTPWYSTRYLAPITTHYHRVGYRITYLPSHHIRIVVNSIPYFYYSGIYYRPYSSGYIVVSAPIGAFIDTLPVGFIAFSIGLSTYYYINDTYYIWDEPRQGYVVIEKPQGADTAIAEATDGRLFAYPKAGQDEEQQAKDRYECHRWGVQESGVDPTREEEEYTSSDTSNYKRAMAACLEGRQYAVK